MQYMYCSISHANTGVSLSYLMLGRALHTRLDLIKPDIGKCMRQCQDLHKVCHERSHKHHFNIGPKNWVRNLHGGHCWITGVVTKIHGSVSYVIRLSNGDEWQQHINQLRKMTQTLSYLLHLQMMTVSYMYHVTTLL